MALAAAAGPLVAQVDETERAPERRLCAAFVDRTRSLDPVHREAALRVFLERLPDLLEEAACTEVLAGTFADEGAWTPRRALHVPAPPDTLSCNAREPAVRQGAAGLLLGLRGFRDHFRREGEEACRRELAGQLESHCRERDAFLRDLRGTLLAPRLEHETETDIVGLVGSLLAAGANPVWVLTDGIDTVHEGDLGLDLADGHRVVLVLVPAREEYGGRRAVERSAADWAQAEISVVRYLMLATVRAWADFAPPFEVGRARPTTFSWFSRLALLPNA